MKKAIVISAGVVLVGGAVLAAYLIPTCSGLDVEQYAFEREKSRPLDCFPDESEESAPSSIASDAIDDSADGPPFDLSGTWGQLQVTTAIAHAPLVGETVTTSTNILRMEIVQDGNSAVMSAEVCAIRQESTSTMGRTIVPQSFIDAIGPSERRVVLEPMESGYRFRQEKYVRILGVELEDALNDPIPEDEDDPRIVDTDGDGNPGITVLVEGVVSGQAYVVQRHWKELCGDVLSEDRVEGYINWDTHQRVVGASSFVLNRTPEATPHPDWELNRFQLRRIDSVLTCEDLIANEEQIFAD